ncbi:MAG: hypothetical protein ABSE71_02610 [Candidatus Micrarchaeaceae archaeon]|jgi:hypothetical protein
MKKDTLSIYYFKKDKYRRARGGKTKLIDVYCASCNALLLVYQKDLPRGALKRCYLDRIFYPPKYSDLQHDKMIKETKEMPKLQCENCKAIIGTPMRYTKHGEDRLAYNLIQGKFIKKNSSNGIGKD